MTNHPADSSTQTELRFVYDAEHRRVQKIISENGIPFDVTAFLYDDFKVIATLDSSGNPKQTFHWTHGQIKKQFISHNSGLSQDSINAALSGVSISLAKSKLRIDQRLQENLADCDPKYGGN